MGDEIQQHFFWIVGNDTRAWSSADNIYVDEWPTSQARHVDTEDELAIALAPLPSPGEVKLSRAVQAHIDAVAKSRGYLDGFSLAGYALDPLHSDEALPFVIWRGQVWSYAYAELTKVRAGERPQPTIPEFIRELPASPWPA